VSLTTDQPSPTSALRSAPFRWLLAGRTVNGLGGAIAPVAMAFAVLDLGGSATELGLVVASYALVDVVTTLFGGVVGDRVSRTALMRGCAVFAAAAQGVVALSLVGAWASIWWLAAMNGLIGCLTALAGPSARAVVQQTVETTALPSAVSTLRLSQNTAAVAGFSAAGLLAATLGSGWAIAIDALTYLLAAGCYSLVRVRPLAPPARRSALHDLRAGAVEVFRHTWLWVLIVQALIYHLVYGGAQGVLGPIVVSDTYGKDAWGWALGALMAGFIVGGVTTLRYRPRRLLLAGTGFLALTACFPLAMGLQLPLAWILLGAFLHGFGLEIFSVNWDLSIQQNVAPDKLARVFAFDQVGSFVMRPVGLAATGLVAELVGATDWLLIIAAVMLVSAAFATLPPSVRTLERRR